MAQYEAQGIELVKQAEKKLKGGIMSSVLGIKKYDEATDLYNKAITQFKLAKACRALIFILVSTSYTM